jgi:TonB family protein
VFDEVLKNERPQRLARRASYLAASTAVQAMVVGATALLVTSLATRPPPGAQPAVEVKFVKGTPRPASPPPAPPSRKLSMPRRPPPTREVAPMVQPKALPEQLPEPGPPEPPPPEPSGPAPSVIGGAVGGGEAVPAPPARVDFDEGSMTRPVFLTGPDLAYTRAAREREVEGLMVVACVVTREGLVRDCRVQQGLPFMDAAVVQALERRRYKPATLKGVPVEVTYQFRINWKLPR